MKKKLIYLFTIISLIMAPFFTFAQQTLGTTGTLNAPSARMQKDKTVLLGGNFLHEKSTPQSLFTYNTFNYFLNATLLPFFEVSYTCTLIKATDNFIPEKKGRFVNQDRSMSARLSVLKERKFLPAIVVGGNDILSSVSNRKLKVTSNQYFSRIYIAFSKKFMIRKEEIDVHLSGIYYRQQKWKGDCISAAISYTPSITRNLNFIVEYDSRWFNIGANYLVFNHLFLQAYLQEGKYLSGGLCYKIYLK